MWIPLALVKFLFVGSTVVWAVIVVYTLLVGCGILLDPIYRDWMRRLFPPEKIGKFIASKNLILDLFSLLPIIFAGLLLDVVQSDPQLIGFVILFLCAGLFRYISSRFLNKISKTEDKDDIVKETTRMSKPIFAVFKKEVLKDKIFFNFLIFVLLYYFGLFISTSYFPYLLLSVLKFSYSDYILWFAAFVLGSVFSLYYWGYVSNKYGSVKIIKTTIAFIPFTLFVEFLFLKNLPVLIILQFVSGIIFAGFNYAILNYFYQNVKVDLINHMSFFYIFQAFAMLAGSLVGAGIIAIGKKVYGNEVQAILLVIAISMAFRFIALLYSKNIKDVNRNKVNLYTSIILQKPVAYSIKHFWHVLSEQERKILHKIRAKN